MSQLKEIFSNLSKGTTGTDSVVPVVVAHLTALTAASAAAIGLVAKYSGVDDNTASLTVVAATLGTAAAGIVGSYAGRGVAKLTQDESSSLSDKSQQALEKTGTALLLSFSLACGGVASYYAYNHTHNNYLESEAVNAALAAKRVNIQLDDPRVCVSVSKETLRAQVAAGECPATPAVK